MTVAFEKTYYFVQPFRKLQTILQRAENLSRDQVRTAHEKRTEAERIAIEKQAVYNQVKSALQTDWSLLKGQYKQLQREKTGAADRSAARWDYNRLEYERKRAGEHLKSAPFHAIKKRFSDIEMSGDLHALRAYAEVGLDILGNVRKFSADQAPELGDIRNGFNQMVDDLTITPEQRELAKQGEILTDKVAEVFDATMKARSEYIKIDALGTFDNVFDRMIEGVNIRRRVDPENLATITEVNLDSWDRD